MPNFVSLLTSIAASLPRVGFALGLTLLIAVLNGQPTLGQEAHSQEQPTVHLASLAQTATQTAQPPTSQAASQPALERQDSLTGVFMTQHRLTGAHLFIESELVTPAPRSALANHPEPLN